MISKEEANILNQEIQSEFGGFIFTPPSPLPVPQKKEPIVEIYREDLEVIDQVLGYVDDLACTGVFSVEVRFKLGDTNTWIVAGYGEAGDPAIIRFES